MVELQLCVCLHVGVESELISSDCLDCPCSFFGKISEVVCYCLLPRAERQWLAQDHSAGFMFKARLKLMFPNF